ncbi:MAG: hypothetical protein K0R39_2385 [Symbiobacteriaceae bacterium]|jgi:lipoprotein-anchoring transpeptidase ErfK/SrfK|nr:hypothetical protein [Symbiobacteriaceae bacterium]
MAGATTGSRRSSSVARRRHQAARRQKYLRRRITLGVLLLGLVVGAYFGLDWALTRWLGSPETPKTTTETIVELDYTPEVLMPVDFDGDKKPDAQVAVGPTVGGERKIALVTGTKAPFARVGPAYGVAAFPLEFMDLPGAKGVLVLKGKFASPGQPQKVDVPGGGQATVAAGGEPDFRAWRADKEKGLVSVDYYALSAPVNPGADIVVDKYINALWFYKDGKLAATYRVATGKYLDGPAPSAANQAQNYITPLGKYQITNLQVNPTYHKTGIAGGDKNNPLGTRFLGFSVYSGDGANVWAIHGTNQPELIGQWVSDGCIRLQNSDVQKLYEQVKEGMTLEIRSSKPQV